jgi:hypothetical protein
MAGQAAEGLVGVGDAEALVRPLRLRQIGIGLVDAGQHRACPRAGEEVDRPILGVGVGGAEALDHLPVAKAQRAGARRGSALDRAAHHAEERGDVAGVARWQAGRILEEGRGPGQRCHIASVLLLGIDQLRVGGGQEDDGIHPDLGQVGAAGLTVDDNPLQRAGVAAQLEQRRGERLAALGIPLGTIDLDHAARAFDVHQVDGVGRQDSQVDLEALVVPGDLEVVQDLVAVRQVIAQVADDLTLNLVDRLADGDDLGHQAAPSMACSTISRACCSRSHALSRRLRASMADAPICKRVSRSGQGIVRF